MKFSKKFGTWPLQAVAKLRTEPVVAFIWYRGITKLNQNKLSWNYLTKL